MEVFFAFAYPVLLGAGAVPLLRRRGPIAKRMGACVLVSALFWALLLVPRGLTSLLDREMDLWLGLGRLGFAAGSAVWIFLLFRLWERIWSSDVRDRLMFLVCAAGALVRILALIPPENRWTENGFSLLWSSVSCGALVVSGAVPAVLWHHTRRREPELRPVWLLLLIWLVLAIPLSAAGRLPVLNWLLAPQAAATLGIAVCFLRTGIRK